MTSFRERPIDNSPSTDLFGAIERSSSFMDSLLGQVKIFFNLILNFWTHILSFRCWRPYQSSRTEDLEKSFASWEALGYGIGGHKERRISFSGWPSFNRHSLGSQASFDQCRPNHDADLKGEGDDEEGLRRYAPGGFHPVRLGERYDNGRYEVLRKLGFGRYSTVWLVRDLRQSKYLAMKVLDAASYDEVAQQMLSEREILTHLRQADPTHPGYTYINHLVDSFEHEGPNGRHICLLFEPMGETLWSYPTWFKECQLPPTAVKRMTAKLLAALQYIHACGVILTDIKPTNIFMKIKDMSRIEHFYLPLTESHIEYQDPRETEYRIVKSCPLRETYFGSVEDAFEVDVCLGDFGTATWKDKDLCEIVQPVDLRAPEVILGMNWDEKIDLWSLGIIIFEVYRCARLFNSADHTGHSPPYHLMQMQQIFGDQTFPESLLNRAEPSLVEAWFGPDNRVKTYENVGVPDLREETWVGKMDAEERDLFISWLHFVMRLDPKDRPSIDEVLRHPWFTLSEDVELEEEEEEAEQEIHEMF